MAGNTFETDVLVVGGGGAGLMAAVHASKQGVKTTLVCKGKSGRSGATILAGAGMSMDGKSACEMGFPGNPEWTRDKMFKEIVLEGFYLNNQKLVELFCRDAAVRIKDLLDWGLKAQFMPPAVFAMPGAEISRACMEGVKQQKVELIDDVMITDILLTESKVAGALGIDINTGEFSIFKTKAVVLGTGGWQQAYPFTSATGELTGDGQAAAYRAGAELVDMEMVTFCPNCVIWPPIYRGSIFGYLVTMMSGAQMLSSRGVDIMRYYDPKIVEIAATSEFNKNIWSIASAREIMAGRATPHGGIWVSMRNLPLQIFDWLEQRWFRHHKTEDFSEIWNQLRQGYAVEVAPAAHYFEGGIAINENCETNIHGLYAAGECSSGTFGANRVADATTEMIVLGGVAGKCAAQYAKKARDIKTDQRQVETLKNKWLASLKRDEGVSPQKVKKEIQRIADNYVGIVRTGSGLKKAVEEIERVRLKELPKVCVTEKSTRYNREWIESVEVENMLLCLEASARSALMRTESRGVHYRTDCLKMDNAKWLKEIVVKKVGGNMHLRTRPVTVTRMEPQKTSTTWEEYVVWIVPQLKELG